ncbi:type IV toxin-antitoxin system YeeU family antitoxin [Escherichia coli]
MSDTLSGTTHPDDNHDRPWWGLPCTVTPCFGARLVQEGNRLHYLTDRAGTRSQLINSIDILRARRATGLMTRDNYRTVNNITLGKHQESKRCN